MLSSYTPLPPHATVQQVLLRHYQPQADVNRGHVQKVLYHLMQCRTAALGYHLYKCTDQACGHIHYQYHSCRDRHCPNCGGLKKQEWIEARMQELLPVSYYHVVFTLPHELNSVIMGYRRLLYKLLFDACSQTLLRFAKDPQYLGAVPGIISVLHSWGQQLSFHPHIHCIVSGGGITTDNRWKHAKRNSYRFLFPVKAMAVVYRAKFVEGLKGMIAKGQVVLPDGTDGQALINLVYQQDWVVYAKAPFGGPQAVIEYLGRYTHKVAISNQRIHSINADGTVTFEYKDYADKGTKKLMTLAAQEFIRRFEQHILPKGFTKIRTYGYLANRNRHTRINAVLTSMGLPVHKGLVTIPLEIRMQQHYGIDIRQCPCCKGKTMQLVQVFFPCCRRSKPVDDS
jgi:hypothetical protein